MVHPQCALGPVTMENRAAAAAAAVTGSSDWNSINRSNKRIGKDGAAAGKGKENSQRCPCACLPQAAFLHTQHLPPTFTPSNPVNVGCVSHEPAIVPLKCRDTYLLDSQCHPFGRCCSSFEDAHELLINNCGGFWNHNPVFRNCGTKPMANGLVQHHCHCRCGNFSEGWQCSLRLQIRALPGNKFAVFSHPFKRSHNHPVSERSAYPRDQHGLDPTLARVCLDIVKRQDQSILRIKPSYFLNHIVHRLEQDKSPSRKRYLVDTVAFCEHTKKQIRMHVSRRRSSFIKLN